MGRALLLLLLLALAAGCGGGSSTQARPLPAVRVPPSFQGPIPGTPVHVAARGFPIVAPSVRELTATGSGPERVPLYVARGFPIVASSVRELAATGSGSERVPLYVARGLNGELCIGTTGIFRCLDPLVASVRPVHALAVFGGRRGVTRWGAVVGLARPGTRVTYSRYGGYAKKVRMRLRRISGFPFAVFASPVIESVSANGLDVLSSLDATAPGTGQTSAGLDLQQVSSPCPNDPADCAASWVIGTDPESEAIGRDELGTVARAIEAGEAVALRDPLVASLLAGRRYAEEPIPSVTGDGRAIGALVRFNLERQATYEEDWPTMGCDPHALYSLSVEHYRATGVEMIQVFVDSRSRKVIGIEPMPGFDERHGFFVSRHRVVVKPHPAGGPATNDCNSGG